MSSGIFISYRREDSVAYAGRLYDRLADRFGREHVFMDLDKINPGQDFVEVLDAKIAECDVLIALIGKQWVTSKDSKRRKRLNLPEDFVRMEISSAMDRGALVVPTLVGGARMPRKRDLPEALADFSRRQAIQIRDDRFHDDVDELVETVETALAEGGRADPPSETKGWGTLAMFGLLMIGLLGGALALFVAKPWKQAVTRADVFGELSPVAIAAGSFEMGCRRGDEDCFDEERPRHRVEISQDFWIGRSEVTVGAFELFAQATERPMPSGPSFNADWSIKDHPIVKVNWFEARSFCNFVGGRLPTEAEWEYAARGGNNRYRYPWGDNFGEGNANYEGSGDGYENTAPVMSFPANGYGLHDMAGNVQEWVADWFKRDYYGMSPDTDPPGPDNGPLRAARSGSWAHEARKLRSSYREPQGPSKGETMVGFRCAWTALPQPE